MRLGNPQIVVRPVSVYYLAMMKTRIPPDRAGLTSNSQPNEIRIISDGPGDPIFLREFAAGPGPARYPTQSEADHGEGLRRRVLSAGVAVSKFVQPEYVSVSSKYCS